MSKLLKFIVHFVVICTILCVIALAVPPFFGVTTQIQDDPSVRSNLPLGSVTYAIPVRAEEMTMGDSILVTEEPSVYKYQIASMDLEEGRGTVVDPAIPNAQPINVAFNDYLPKVVIQVPFIGYLLKATQSLEGLVILGLVVLFLIILYVIAELWKPRKDEDGSYENNYYSADTEPGRTKTSRELKRDEKNRQKAMAREEQAIRQEERYRKRSPGGGGKVRTGGFVDEVDESDFDDYYEDSYGYDEVDNVYNATSDAHESLRRGVAEVTQDDFYEEDPYEDRRRAPQQGQRQSRRPQVQRQGAGQGRRSQANGRRRLDDFQEEDLEKLQEGRQMAIPRYSAGQMARKARNAGDNPEVFQDDVTGVTQFDYSDILFDDGDSMDDEE